MAALEVVAGLGDSVRVTGLAAHRNWQLLAEQSRRFGVPHVALSDTAGESALRAELPGVRIWPGPNGLAEMVRQIPADFVLAAVVGAAGLPATLAAVERGLDIGLANKESLVVAGALLMPLARERGGQVIPVDSEHSAVFQALQCGRREDAHKIYLTASGGPFRTWPTERIHAATLEDALKHPTWSMGPKITIDSATMMNKALEIIEARHLFDLAPEQIDVLIHPESIVHSMVEFRDGSLIAQLGVPDMKTPIQYAFTFPGRAPAPAQRLDWATARTLHFEPPDFERFPALRLGYEAAGRGGTVGAVLNAANEAAVEQFRRGVISFGEISKLIEDVMARHTVIADPTLDDLLMADRWARQEACACTN